MEPEHIIDETIVIHGDSIDEVYDRCHEWLHSIKANIGKEKKPEFLRAFHYRNNTLISSSDSGWDWHPKNYPKKMELKLSKNDRINLRFTIERPTGYYTEAAIRKYQRWWILLLIDLAKHLKIDEDLSYSEKYLSKQNLEEMKIDIMYEFGFPLYFSYMMILIGVFLFFSHPVGIIFVIGGIYVPLRVYHELKSLGKHLRELNPDK